MPSLADYYRAQLWEHENKMSEEPKEASEKNPDELLINPKDGAEDTMRNWQMAHANSDMARMAKEDFPDDEEMQKVSATFRAVERACLLTQYNYMMSMQSHQVYKLKQKHEEDEKNGITEQNKKFKIFEAES